MLYSLGPGRINEVIVEPCVSQPNSFCCSFSASVRANHANYRLSSKEVALDLLVEVCSPTISTHLRRHYKSEGLREGCSWPTSQKLPPGALFISFHPCPHPTERPTYSPLKIGFEEWHILNAWVLHHNFYQPKREKGRHNRIKVYWNILSACC